VNDIGFQANDIGSLSIIKALGTHHLLIVSLSYPNHLEVGVVAYYTI
jgi:hypothetical protein